MYLVQLHKSSGKLIVEDDGVYGISEFLEVIQKKGYGEPMMRCVALFSDYDTPFRHINEKDRVRMVARNVLGKAKEDLFNINDPFIEAAIAKYMLLQFCPYRDEKKNTLKTINDLVALKNKIRVTEENVEKIQKIVKSISFFENRLKDLDELIETEGEDGPVKRNLSLTRLEQKLQMESF